MNQSTLSDILDCADQRLNDIPPSQWYEANRVMTTDLTDMPGPFRYDMSPYCKEIVDCLSPLHPAREIAVMKGAQVGFTTGVIEPGIGWTIANEPCGTLLLVGHEENMRDAVEKIDKMIDGTGIRHLIKPTTFRARNVKSGDTDKRKDFAGGHLRIGLTNPKSLRNFSVRVGFIDDYDAMKGSSKSAGDTRALVQQRFAAFAEKKKIMYISTPELMESSNIFDVYKRGDQRLFNIPCPRCGKYIHLDWQIQMDGGEMAGIHWKLDDTNHLIRESVGYICQKCGNFFDDSMKMELLRSAQWIPTATPERPDIFSYQLSALYAPIFMDRWVDYVYKYLEANPVGQPRNENKWQSFQNLALGLPYEQKGSELNANEIQRNIRPYEVFTVPEKLSIADGNGEIVMLTCACDLNGKLDDARLDWEILAWSESGASYSLAHGSIGTFVLKSKGGEEMQRDKWSYERGHPLSVWPEFEKVRTTQYQVDTGRKMAIMITGVDAGHFTEQVYSYVDASGPLVIALKGSPNEKKLLSLDVEKRTFKQSVNKGKLYLVESNIVKDQLATYISQKWDKKVQAMQPWGFMNFPTPTAGKFNYLGYFEHFEAEHRIVDKEGKFGWVKKSTNHENHFWDVRCYNIVVKDILLKMVFAEAKIKNGIWNDFVNLIIPKK